MAASERLLSKVAALDTEEVDAPVNDARRDIDPDKDDVIVIEPTQLAKDPTTRSPDIVIDQLEVAANPTSRVINPDKDALIVQLAVRSSVEPTDKEADALTATTLDPANPMYLDTSADRLDDAEIAPPMSIIEPTNRSLVNDMEEDDVPENARIDPRSADPELEIVQAPFHEEREPESRFPVRSSTEDEDPPRPTDLSMPPDTALDTEISPVTETTLIRSADVAHVAEIDPARDRTRSTSPSPLVEIGLDPDRDRCLSKSVDKEVDRETVASSTRSRVIEPDATVVTWELALMDRRQDRVPVAELDAVKVPAHEATDPIARSPVKTLEIASEEDRPTDLIIPAEQAVDPDRDPARRRDLLRSASVVVVNEIDAESPRTRSIELVNVLDTMQEAVTFFVRLSVADADESNAVEADRFKVRVKAPAKVADPSQEASKNLSRVIEVWSAPPAPADPATPRRRFSAPVNVDTVFTDPLIDRLRLKSATEEELNSTVELNDLLRRILPAVAETPLIVPDTEHTRVSR